jgi:hypothetical protein
MKKKVFPIWINADDEENMDTKIQNSIQCLGFLQALRLFVGNLAEEIECSGFGWVTETFQLINLIVKTLSTPRLSNWRLQLVS